MKLWNENPNFQQGVRFQQERSLIMGFGVNDFGQLNPSVDEQCKPTGGKLYYLNPLHLGFWEKQPFAHEIKLIRCGASFTLILTDSGSVYAMGHKDFKMGLSDDVVKLAFDEGQEIVEMETGMFHAVFLSKRGRIYTYGYNEFGCCGLKESTKILKPTILPVLFQDLWKRAFTKITAFMPGRKKILSPRHDNVWKDENLELINLKKTQKMMIFPLKRAKYVHFYEIEATELLDLPHIQRIRQELPDLMMNLASISLDERLSAIRTISEIICQKVNHQLAVETFMKSDTIFSLIGGMDDEHEEFQKLVLKCLASLSASLDEAVAERILEAGCIKAIISILENSENDDILEFATTLAGNLCIHRETMVNREVLLVPILQTMTYSPPPSLLVSCVWAISNLLYSLSFEFAKDTIPAFSFMIEESDTLDEVCLLHACRGLYYLSLNIETNEVEPEFGNLIDKRTLEVLVELFCCENTEIQRFCVNMIGNIVTSDDIHIIDSVLETPILQFIKKTLDEGDNSYAEKIYDFIWILSNFLCGSVHQIESIINANLIPLILNTFQNSSDAKIKTMCCVALSNGITCCTVVQKKLFHKLNCHEQISALLNHEDDKIVLLILEALEDIINSNMTLSSEIESRIEKVSNHTNRKVYDRGQRIMSLINKFQKVGAYKRRKIHEIPPAPKPRHVATNFCTYQGSFIVFGGLEMWVCGVNDHFQLGTDAGDENGIIHEPVKVLIPEMVGKIKKIVGGLHHTIVLTTEGYIYGAGSNEFGALSSPRWKDRFRKFTRIYFPDEHMKVSDVSAGAFHTVYLSAFNQVWVTGRNSKGQLGIGHYTDTKVPKKLRFTDVESIYTGMLSTGIKTFHNEVFFCGSNQYGELGMGTTSTYSKMRKSKVPLLTQELDLIERNIFTGISHFVVLDTFELTMGSRLHLSQREKLFSDVQIQLQRLDSNFKLVEIGEKEFELRGLHREEFESLHMHARLEFIAVKLLNWDLEHGTVLPNEKEKKEDLPKDMHYFDQKDVDGLCQYITTKEDASGFDEDAIRREIVNLARMKRKQMQMRNRTTILPF